MFDLPIGNQNLLELGWQGELGDYVSAIAWSPMGDTLAASSAAGKLVLWTPDTLEELQSETGASLDRIAFSSDGQFLASGGQDGQVRIWDLPSRQLITNPDGKAGTTATPLHPTRSKPWVEKLAWSPLRNQLAFSLGRVVQIWDAALGEVTATLNFEASSVLGLDWHPDGQYLAVCGHRGVKVWSVQDWHQAPDILDIRAASIAIAWSPDGKYLASGNMDRTLTVMEWRHPDPWMMRGFPGKIRTVTWSEPLTASGSPLLAVACAQSIAVWEKPLDQSVGWEARELDLHEGTVQAIAFQPGSFLLASAADDGYVCLWQGAEQVAQVLAGAAFSEEGDTSTGCSSLAWHPQGQYLATGGQNGELLIWSKPRAKLNRQKDC